MSNSADCEFDNIGSKCKKMYRFKISAFAGMTSWATNIDVMYKYRLSK
jgi:hypothetical protein